MFRRRPGRLLNVLCSFVRSIYVLCLRCQLCHLQSNIGFLNTSNGFIFLKHSGAFVRRCSSKWVFLKFSKISWENICVGLYFYKVTGLQDCDFIKKRLQHKCFRVKFSKALTITFFNTSGGCWELVCMATKNLLREVRFYGVVQITHEGVYFCGFIAFEKLKYSARFEVVEGSTMKQPRTQSNFKYIAKRWAKMRWGRGWH